MGTLIITSAILALATAAFVAFWDAIVAFCVNLIAKVTSSFITFIKSSYQVCAYLYRRKNGSWYRQEVQVQRIKVADCPLSVRNALFKYDEVIVHNY